MNWQDIGKSVASVAPLLGAVLGGPIGAVAGAAGTLLGSFLGVEPAPDQIAHALADPATLLRLKELESRQQDRLLEWQGAQLNAELENVKSARAREVELAKAGHGASWGTSIVAIIVTLGFFVMLGVVLAGNKAELGEAGIMLLGTLAASFGAVINYYLGSSSGSTAKSQQIATLKEKP
ncbi:MAG: hypothetical protein RRY29_09325 [Desulfovibrionaceae bacterium]